jgi:Family of unknown function (DUF5985)
MAMIAYGVGVLTSWVCALLLIRSYRRYRTPLLLWCCLCFIGLGVNNALLFVDLFLVAMSLEVWRNLVALLSLMVLLVGLVGAEP